MSPIGSLPFTTQPFLPNQEKKGRKSRYVWRKHVAHWKRKHTASPAEWHLHLSMRQVVLKCPKLRPIATFWGMQMWQKMRRNNDSKSAACISLRDFFLKQTTLYIMEITSIFQRQLAKTHLYIISTVDFRLCGWIAKNCILILTKDLVFPPQVLKISLSNKVLNKSAGLANLFSSKDP